MFVCKPHNMQRLLVRELVGLELHPPLAVGHHAVALAHLRTAPVEQQGHGGGVGTAFLHIQPGAGKLHFPCAATAAILLLATIKHA